jgi:hydroxymethylglutaryl-CoA reductase
MTPVTGFSKLSKSQKIEWLASHFQGDSAEEMRAIARFWNSDEGVQRRFDEFSENTLTNYYLPFGVAPNFLINGRHYTVPMVIEESSVVAAAALAAKFWSTRGGFHARVVSTRKVGHVHFLWQGDARELTERFEIFRGQLVERLLPLTASMVQRGGGLVGVTLENRTNDLADYWQLKLEFETCDAMGANFINTVLEEAARQLQAELPAVEVVMCILSNFTPDCVVECHVECPVADLGDFAGGMDAATFARRFKTAVDIARVDKARAVTHNKGVMNGVDAVVLATGNDFRAVEACAHAWAAEGGSYKSLSTCTVENGMFRFSLRLPLALGTVGGLTKLHPLARISLELLQRPSAPELMQVAAAVGLAQNFAAVRSLTTTGIQKGHMKLHLLNILTQLGADDATKVRARAHFADKVVSFSAVREFVQQGLAQ